MRVHVLVVAALLLTPMAWCQKGLEGQSAKNPDLIRALDAASAALANAQREAANGKVEPFKTALDKANLRWSECYSKYREWPTSDTAWRSNFDSINNLLLAAVNAITPAAARTCCPPTARRCGSNRPSSIEAATPPRSTPQTTSGCPTARTNSAPASCPWTWRWYR